MALEVGSIVEGEISGITNFGAFVQLADGKVGLIHISEVSNVYVKDVHDFLKEKEKVKVKVLSVDERGKVGLSIKSLMPASERPERPKREGRPDSESNNRGPSRNSSENGGERKFGGDRKFSGDRRNNNNNRRNAAPKQPVIVTFEDKLSLFLKDSDDRLLDLRRNTDSKRGGRGGRRGE